MVLRFQLPHHALAVLYGVHRATITRAIHELRPLLAKRGFAVPGMPGVRLRTLADVVAYAQAEGVELRLDGTETQVRRPRANRLGRRAFVSGKKKQNTIKVSTVCDGRGRTLWAGAVRPGRMHDQTAIKTEGIEELLRRHDDVHATVDAGYRGLAKAFGGRVHPPPPKPGKDAPSEELAAYRLARSSSRPSGSASSMPTPSISSGGRCSAGSGGGSTTPKPTWPSPGWSPTGRPAADHYPAQTGRASTPQPQSRTKSLELVSYLQPVQLLEADQRRRHRFCTSRYALPEG